MGNELGALSAVVGVCAALASVRAGGELFAEAVLPAAWGPGAGGPGDG